MNDPANLHTKVADLIASRDAAGHNKAHDDYFARFSTWQENARKPFHWLVETPPMLAQLSAVIAIADLFPGARVLDYGCGTGWLTKYLAYLGCHAEGVDVSERAIGWAQEMIAADPLRDRLQISFQAIDGVRLPFPGDSFDRIICFASFHHVADQQSTIREFARVLTPSGRAILNEPGPDHANSASAQSEMHEHGVIENNIVIEEIAQYAADCGLQSPRLAAFMPRPVVLDYAEYQSVMQPSSALPPSVRQTLADEMTPIRVFLLEKPGTAPADSRRADGLRGELSVYQQGGRWYATYKNLGSRWLPSTPNRVGSVSIGVKIRERGVLREHGRIQISAENVEHGEEGAIDFTLPRAEEYVFDLVAEHVTWFSAIGASRSVTVRLA